MVGASDFDKVKYNEAYMLVYNLKKPSSAQPMKQMIATQVHSSNQNSDKSLKDSKNHLQITTLSINKSNNQKLNIIEIAKDKQFESLNVLNISGSNEKQTLDIKQNSKEFKLLDLVLDCPIKKTVIFQISNPSHHPLFGNITLNWNSDLKTTKANPSWYVDNNLDSQLQKRKPTDISSRNSSSKKRIKPIHLGFQKIKDMGKKMRNLGYFSSLPVSRVVSSEVKTTFNQLDIFQDLMKA